MSYEGKNRDTIVAAVDGVSESVTSSLAADDTNSRLGDQVASFKYFLRVFAYNDAFGWALNIVAFVCMLASGTILPLMDIFFGRFVNVFSEFASGRLPPTAYLAEVSRYTLYFIYLFVAKFILTYLWTILINITAIRATKRLRVDFVRQTLRQEISYFDAPSTSMSSQLASNGNLVSNGVSEKLGAAIQALASFITAFAVAFVVQWKLTLVVLAVVPLNIVVTIICIVRDTALEYRIFDIYGQSGSLAEEAIANIRTVHAFWAFPELSRRFDAILAKAETIGRAKSVIYAVLFPIEYFCVIAGYALAFWQGMRMYASGEIDDPGTIVTVVFAVLVAAQALTQIAPQTVAISKATAAAQDLFAVIDRQSAIDSLDSKGLHIGDFQGKIQMRGLRFAYPSRPDVWVLNGLDLFIPPNKITAIVGASGSGKSSIFGLLERWYSHSEGSILMDDQRIEGVNLQWLRTNIRLVQQEPMLFSGTIFQNVADGLSGTNMADLPDQEKRRLVCDACMAAFAHEFIVALPNGYDTLVAERGASLSGGQKQRLVIARSIISNPRVLLLDEATSALDPKAEKIVQAALNNVACSRTTVVIAHRLSTVRDADNIVVMSRGQVIETGTHQQLLSREGHYARLVRAQDLGAASDMTEPFTEHDVNVEEPDHSLTRASSTRESAATVMRDEPHLGLLRGLCLIVQEQQSLRWPMLMTVICCILGGMTYPALAVLFSETMDRFNKVDLAGVNFFSLMFFVVALGNVVVYAVSGWLSNILAQTVMRHYRSELFHNTLRQNMEFFDQPEHSTGALVSRLAAEPTALQELLSFNVALLLINAVNLASSSVLAIASGWKLGLALVLGALPVLVGAGYVRIRLEFRFEQDTAARFAASSGIAAEAVMGIRTVASLVLEQAVVQRYEDQLKGIAAQAVSSLGWKMSFYALSQSVSLLAMAFGFWYGSRLVASGEYSTVQFYTVFAAVIFSGESAALLFQYTTSISKARTAIDYILRMRRSRSLTDVNGKEVNPCFVEKSKSRSGMTGDELQEEMVQGSQISFEAVDFAYSRRPNHSVLRGVNIAVRSGSSIAFVGASGSGKSTMISLLERFYDPCAGRIIADGRDVTRLDRCQYRRDVALVQQEPVLFQGSVRENIALGLVQSVASPLGDTSTEARIIAACRDANAWDFIASLPQGLDTPCGGQGLSLSGGQRQRIALARALVRQPRLLLLDEATSALDTESEKLVKQALDRAAEGRTTVAVAHRLCTIRDADLILVFASGTIVESGVHEDLVAQRGLYYEMVLGQSLDRDTS